MHQMVMSKRMESILRDVIVMFSLDSRLQTLPCRFVGFHDTSTLGFLVCVSVSTRYNFPQLLKRLLHSILQGVAAPKSVSSFFRTIDEVNTSQFSSIVELWLLNSPFLLFLLLGCFRHPKIIWSGSCLDLRQALSRPHVSWNRFLHPNLCELIWSRQKTSVILVMILPSAHRAELEVQRDDDK